MSNNDIALIGLGVMGQNLALNLANHGIEVIVWDRHSEKTRQFLAREKHPKIDICQDFNCLHQKLHRPRSYWLMVKAGQPTDEVLGQLLPHLDKGDIVIDGGNAYYKDTQRRYKMLKAKGIHFVGMGVSGGEEGALLGPCLMPGGDPEAIKALMPLFKKIAAKDFKGKPCVTHVGPDGAGHYVKMVHNGIEYGLMQMMAEAYDVFKRIYRLPADKIGALFKTYAHGPLKSFLFDSAVPVLTQKDEFKKGNLLDFILDRAGQKGTGQWMALDALVRSIPIPTISQAVFERNLSSLREMRIVLSKIYKKVSAKPALSLNQCVRLMQDALYAGMLSTYSQGFQQLQTAAREQDWKIDLAEIARIWQGGCIIRASLLDLLAKALRSNRKPVHLFFIPQVRQVLKKNLGAWRKMVSLAVNQGVPAPALASSLSYFESLTSENLPANFIQGLRDYFGAHTYERIDRPGSFHTNWS